MPRARREWLRFSWCLIIFLSFAAAISCASHPPGHNHDVGHPPLCADTSSPATLAQGRPGVAIDAGVLPLSPKHLSSIMPLAALSGQALPSLQPWPEALSHGDTRTPISPPMFLVVLRQ